MDMFTHSPGPWTRAEANSCIPIKANGRTIASVRYGERDDPNSRLIAAAPDLLHALEISRQAIGLLAALARPQQELDGTYALIDAAIAKACDQ